MPEGYDYYEPYGGPFVILPAQIVTSDGRVVGTLDDIKISGGSKYITLDGSLSADDIKSLQFKVTLPDGTVVTEPLGLGDANIGEKVEYTTPENIILEYLNLLWNVVTFQWDKVLDYIVNMISALLNGFLVSLGDGIIAFISRSVGEVVTLDNLIFGKVQKVSVDYWSVVDKTTGGILPGKEKTVPGMMSKVVIPWYNTFYKIAVIVYMISLIIVGIMVMLNSTADKKARYKDSMVSWIVGVTMLIFFPYVMKYIVLLNNAVVKSLEVYQNGVHVSSGDAETMPVLVQRDASGKYIKEDREISKSYGKDLFLEYMTSTGEMYSMQMINGVETKAIDPALINDNMLQVRVFAQKLNQVFLTAIYFILIGQTVILLFMYYKRAFMVAFLITIFPLVCMTYMVDKIGDKKAQSFEIWFKEYIVNVIVQIFHAIVYVLLVGSSTANFVATGGKNWLFIIMSTLFLFQGEKILRNIFGIKSAANTIGDLATTGLAAYGAVKGIESFMKGGKKSNASDQDNKEGAGFTQREGQRAQIGNAPNQAAENARAEMNNADGDDGGGGNAGSYDANNEPEGVNTSNNDGRGVLDSTIKSSMARRFANGIASNGVRTAGGLAGGMIAATYGMSKGDTGTGSVMGNAFNSAIVGKSLGQAAVSPVTFAANKVEQKVHSHGVSKQIENGEMDEQVAELARSFGYTQAEIDENAIIGQHGETVQEIFRRALQEATKSGSKGATKGELAFWNYLDKNIRR